MPTKHAPKARKVRKPWELKPMTLYISSERGGTCDEVIRVLQARDDALVDRISLIAVETLTRGSVPPFLRGTPTLFFRDMQGDSGRVEGTAVVEVLARLQVPDEAPKRFRGINLANFGGRRKGGTIGSSLATCKRQTSQRTDNTLQNRQSSSHRILRTQLRAAHSADARSDKSLPVKERIKAMEKRREAAARRALQLQKRVMASGAANGKKFLGARKE